MAEDMEIEFCGEGGIARQGDQIFGILSELRLTGNFCDAVIAAGNQRYPIHRNIMSACSPYFKTLFTSQEPGSTYKKEVVIPGIPSNLVHVLIDFAYTGTASITPANVELLLSIADQYHVTGLLTLCCQYLHMSLTCHNCLGILRIAQFYSCSQLERAAWKYVIRHFSRIFRNSNEFLQLPVNMLCTILSSDYLNVTCEGHVFDAICRWIKFDKDRRKEKLNQLLATVRLGLLPSDDFTAKVKDHYLVKASPDCKPLLDQTESVLEELDKTDEPDFDMSVYLVRPRVPHEILFVIGGWSGGKPITMVETYDTRADRWIVCTSEDEIPRAYHGVVALGCLIYIVGGFNTTECFNSCRVFDTRTKRWSEIAPMNHKRSYVSTVHLDGLIYAMGGFEGPPRGPVAAGSQLRLKSAERFDPATNQWTFVAPMLARRSDASATTLKGDIYICGGFNGSVCLSSAEVYSPFANQWTLLPAMAIPRSGVGVIAFCDNVFVVGGFDGESRIRSAEKYSPVDREWTAIPDMYNARSNFAIEVMDDLLFVCGGFDGDTTIFHVECFDYSAQEWYHATDMNLYKSAMGACVVRDLDDVTDYIYKKKERTPAINSRLSESCSSST